MKDGHLEEVVGLNCIPLLVKNLKSDVINVIQHSIKILSCIVAGNDVQFKVN